MVREQLKRHLVKEAGKLITFDEWNDSYQLLHTHHLPFSRNIWTPNLLDFIYHSFRCESLKHAGISSLACTSIDAMLGWAVTNSVDAVMGVLDLIPDSAHHLWFLLQISYWNTLQLWYLSFLVGHSGSQLFHTACQWLRIKPKLHF